MKEYCLVLEKGIFKMQIESNFEVIKLLLEGHNMFAREDYGKCKKIEDLQNIFEKKGYRVTLIEL